MNGTVGSTVSGLPRFLADENLEIAIVRGVRRQRPNATFYTAKEASIVGLSDPDVLERAQELDLILISHDARTLYDHFGAFLMGLPVGTYSPGVFLVSQEKYSIGQIIEFIVDIYDLSSHEEWRNQIARLPL